MSEDTSLSMEAWETSNPAGQKKIHDLRVILSCLLSLQGVTHSRGCIHMPRCTNNTTTVQNDSIIALKSLKSILSKLKSRSTQDRKTVTVCIKRLCYIEYL